MSISLHDALLRSNGDGAVDGEKIVVQIGEGLGGEVVGYAVIGLGDAARDGRQSVAVAAYRNGDAERRNGDGGRGARGRGRSARRARAAVTRNQPNAIAGFEARNSVFCCDFGELTPYFWGKYLTIVHIAKYNRDIIQERFNYG